MKKLIVTLILFLIIISQLFSEILILKNGKEIKGKIIKMDEDTITVITKKEEIVIERDNIKITFFDENEYKKVLEAESL